MGAKYNLSSLTEFSYDSARNLVYMASSTGTLNVFDPVAGTLTPRLTLGGTLTGLDMTPDGRFLVVGSSDQTPNSDPAKTPVNAAMDKFYKISLTDMSVSTVTFRTHMGTQGGVTDVGAISSDLTLATTTVNPASNVYSYMHLYDARTDSAPHIGVMDTMSVMIGTGARLTASENHKYILFQDGASTTSYGKLGIYFTELHDFLAMGNNFSFKTSGPMTGHSVVSDAAGLVAHQTTNSLLILDRFLRPLKDLSDFGSSTKIVGLQFNAGGHQLFLWDTQRDTVRVVETGTWQEVGEIKLASDVPTGQIGAPWGDMVIADNGRALILDTLDGFEVVDLTADLKINQVGGAGAGTMYGSVGANTLSGGAGNDVLYGAGAANYLRGDDGSDSISGGAGFDDINGNLGNDTAHGNAGDDWVVGGKDDDLLYGDAGGDIVYGNIGNDTCYGDDGADIVRGGQGDDSVSGGGGNDWLSGDRGNDTLSGGAGADTFNVFAGAGVDRVTDFNAAEGDKVRIEGGASYAVRQVGGDTVVDLGGGDSLTLVGVASSSLPSGWIFTA